MVHLKNNKFFQQFLWIIIITLSLVLILFLIMFFVQRNDSLENTKDVAELWTIYDINIDEIKYNLNEIVDSPTDSTVCGNLKSVSIDDGSYLFALNHLACSINLYYYGLIEFNDSYNNYLIDYREKTEVTTDEVVDLKDKLKNDNDFYKRLKTILALNYTDKELINDLFDKINNFLDTFNLAFYDQENLTYKEIFVHKVAELTYVTYLSNWLKAEYYSYIN